MRLRLELASRDGAIMMNFFLGEPGHASCPLRMPLGWLQRNYKATDVNSRHVEDAGLGSEARPDEECIDSFCDAIHNRAEEASVPRRSRRPPLCI